MFTLDCGEESHGTNDSIFYTVGKFGVDWGRLYLLCKYAYIITIRSSKVHKESYSNDLLDVYDTVMSPRLMS